MSSTFVHLRGDLCLLLLQFQEKLAKESGLESRALEELQQLSQNAQGCLQEAAERSELVLQHASEKQASTWAYLIASIVQGSTEFLPLAQALAKKIAATSSPKDALSRLQILQIIYNSFPNSSQERYELLCVLIEFAITTNHASVLVSTFPKINAWLTGGIWAGVEAEQRRRLHTLMYQALLSIPGAELTAYRTLVEVLETYSAVDVQNGIALELAVVAAKLAIRLPEVHQCDELLSLSAIAHLANHASHANLYQLLSLFAHDGVGGYLTFHETNAAWLAEVGLSHEQCLKKIRLLTLTSVAAQSRTLSYAAIAQSLAIPIDDVEYWVVLAISNKLLDAKMDQIQHTVTINQTNQRVFSTQQWKRLSERLHLWRANVAACAEAFSLSASSSSSSSSSSSASTTSGKAH